MSFELITLFAALVPAASNPRKSDVAIYKDPERTQLYVRIPWWHSKKPKKHAEKITLNCFQWKLQWVA